MPSYSGVWTLTAQYQAAGEYNWPGMVPPISGTIGLFGGGGSNVIDYILIATAGNATDFGDMTISSSYGAGCSSSTRGILAASQDTSIDSNVINYVTINTTGNALDFGDLTSPSDLIGACSSSTRGIFSLGYLL